MPLPTSIPLATRNAINNWADAVRDLAVTKQAAYFARRGRYAQHRRCSTAIPVAGVDGAPDRQDEKPSDHDRSWRDHSLPAAIKTQVCVNAYCAPGGHGWEIVGRVQHAGGVYVAAYAEGPESAVRTYGWRQES